MNSGVEKTARPAILAILDAEGAHAGQLLEKLVLTLTAEGVALCGVLAVETPQERLARGQMHLRNISTGQITCISQHLGKTARGCKLDHCALASVAVQLADEMRSGPDLLVINRFGRAEAEGHGLRDLFAEALALDVPVITVVRKEHRSAFEEFAGEWGQIIPADMTILKEAVGAHGNNGEHPRPFITDSMDKSAAYRQS